MEWLTPSFALSILSIVVSVTASVVVVQTKQKALEERFAALEHRAVTKDVLDAHLARIDSGLTNVLSAVNRLDGRLDALRSHN